MTTNSKDNNEVLRSEKRKRTSGKRKRPGNKKTVASAKQMSVTKSAKSASGRKSNERTSEFSDAGAAKGLLHGHWQNVAMLLTVYDIIAVNLAYFLALWLRFDCKFTTIGHDYLSAWAKFAPIYALFCLIIFWKSRLYKSIWKYASYTELMYLITATGITGLFHTLFITILYRRMPISYYCVGIMLQFIFLAGVRFSYRLVLLLRSQQKIARSNESRVMVIGAGNAGQELIRDINRAKEVEDKVCCVIDDDTNKWGRFIEGVPIVGGRDDIFASVQKYQIKKIYLAIPSATAEQRRDILNICKETDCELKNLPGMYQFVRGEVTVSKMKKVSVEDLLGREPIKADMQEVFEFINGKKVLVTGGGGSIGSELCRQIAAHNPRQLIIFDIYENNAYDIQMELREKYPDLDLVVLIGSVRDSRRIFGVFDEYRPQVVYHAAAHKHVPLMEDSPNEAIKNNAIGTYKTAYAAMVHGCERFVLISTDKAVRPTNVMGASKRICEMIVQTYDKLSKDEIGQMQSATNMLAVKLKEIMSRSNEMARSLTSAGEELASSSDQASQASGQVTLAVDEISQGAVSQATSVENAAGNTNDIGNDIEVIASNVEQLDTFAGEMKATCNEAMDALEKLVEQTRELRGSVKNIDDTIRSTNESANGIHEFVNAITSIASQTNLLSLNASIEAARAGEAGRGFAVVAGEIAQLAEQSNQSAQEIGHIVEKLLHDAAESVDVMAKLNESFESQTEQMRTTRSNMESMASGVENVAESAQAIAEKIEGLTGAKDTLVGIVSDLSAISEENAASTQETNASMQELNATFTVITQSANELQGLAKELEEIISYFG